MLRNAAGSTASATASLVGAEVESAAAAGSSRTSPSTTHARLACTEILPDERGPTCADLLNRTVQWLAELGIPIERVMTDNAFAYANSRDFRHALATVGARHLTAKPYRSHTDGKAACFIQSALQEWLYAKPTPAPANAQTT